jgi:hypothetical protein
MATEARWAVETMTQSYETGKRVTELGAKQPHELLMMLGGVLAILLSAAFNGIRWVSPGIPTNQMPDVVTSVIINIVLGGALLASAIVTRKNLMNGAIVAGVIGVLLIAYGGYPSGTIGGIVGVLGAILAGANPYLPWSRDESRDQ